MTIPILFIALLGGVFSFRGWEKPSSQWHKFGRLFWLVSMLMAMGEAIQDKPSGSQFFLIIIGLVSLVLLIIMQKQTD